MTQPRLYRHTSARHGRMIVFANDTGAVTSSLLRYGEWAEHEINFMTSLVGEGATILDIGAYIGTHTLAFSRLVGSEGKVYAFEPQPQSFRLLQRNVTLNELSNVELHEAAVGREMGDTVFEPTDPSSSASFGSAALSPAVEESADGVPNEDKRHVPIISVDALNVTRCDLIKIDVEGMEQSALEGARRTTERLHPWFFVECNSIESGLATWHYLQSVGYGVRFYMADAFNSQNSKGVADNIFGNAREAAIVGVPPGQQWRLDARPLNESEMLLHLETADDLALGMLNKPQYVGEILEGSAAAFSGGDRWFDAHNLSMPQLEQTDVERAQKHSEEELRVQMQEVATISAQLSRTQAALEDAQRLAIERMRELGHVTGRLDRTQDALDEVQKLATERFDKIQALEAMVEATLRQSDIARKLYLKADEPPPAVSELSTALPVQVGHQESRLVLIQEQPDERLNELEKRVKASEDEITALLGSTSWRVTHPIRVISRALRRH